MKKEYFYSITVKYSERFIDRFFGFERTYNLNGVVETNATRYDEIFNRLLKEIEEKRDIKRYAIISVFIAPNNL